MELKPETRTALNGWININTPTWYTNHSYDMQRFNNFVDCYSREHGYSIDEEELREEIIGTLSPTGQLSEELERVLQSRASLANDILEFLKQTGR